MESARTPQKNGSSQRGSHLSMFASSPIQPHKWIPGSGSPHRLTIPAQHLTKAIWRREDPPKSEHAQELKRGLHHKLMRTHCFDMLKSRESGKLCELLMGPQAGSSLQLSANISCCRHWPGRRPTVTESSSHSTRSGPPLQELRVKCIFLAQQGRLDLGNGDQSGLPDCQHSPEKGCEAGHGI